ncbi:MAG: SpoIIE family protein phosphatase [Terracidiphilus sp.]|jgi:serine phosphatase RsbU (regulator of sigma subunit)
MPDNSAIHETVLEVVFPGRPHQLVPVTQSPFLIGRGSDAGNHLQLEDRRISRNCAVLVAEQGGYRLEDRGHRQGIFVNGEKVAQKTLQDGDVIHFGIEDCCQIIVHSSAAPAAAPTDIESMLTRLGSMASMTGTQLSGGLSRLNLLLEATSLLHSQLPLESVLGAMLDHTIAITHADRGLLIEPGAAGSFRVRLARGKGGKELAPESVAPSQTALGQAIDRQAPVISEDLNQADVDLKSAESVVVQRLRSVVAIPLYAMPRANSADSMVLKRGEFLGAIYLDSRRPAAFSALDRQILDALGVEAASILDNARLVERERERQRLEQELSIARAIQQALLPQGTHDLPHLAVTGMHYPCYEVGGDYFDVFSAGEKRTAFLIADVSGKGLGAALLTTMLQGALSAMALVADPVRVFNHINKFLCEHGEVGRYATMFFGLIDRGGRLEYVKAGHPSPLLLRRGKVSELYSEGSFPVGLIKDAEFTSASLQLEPDDTLILFSDGITEAENPERELYGESRLHEALAGRQNEPLDTLKQVVLDSVQEFSRGASQSDDMTLLFARYRAPA